VKCLILCGGSLTEARTLLPVIRYLRDVPGVELEVLLTQHMYDDDRTRDTSRVLTAAGVDHQVTRFGSAIRVDPCLARVAPACIVACNDNLILNRLFLKYGNRRGIPFCLIDEAPSAGLLGPVNNTLRDLPWLLRNLKSLCFLFWVLAVNGQWRELGSRIIRTPLRRSLRNQGYGFGPVAVSFVFSEFDREYLLAHGARAREIVATGLPGITVHKNPDPSKPKIYDYLFLSAGEGQFIMTIAQQIAMFQEMADAIRVRQPEARMVFKPHPLESPDVVAALGRTMDIAPDLNQAFDDSAMALGTVTTSLFQALLAGLPIVSLAPGPHGWPDLFIQRICRENGLLARDSEALCRLLDDRDGIEARCRAIAAEWSNCLEGAVGRISQKILEVGGH